MNLSLKATRFVIEALEHYQKYHDERLQQQGLPEDEASDLANDRQYLEAIKQEFQEYQHALLRRREGAGGDEALPREMPASPGSP